MNRSIKLLKEYTQHEQLKLVPSGNAAIFAAIAMAKNKSRKAFILIPDQGGWLTYEPYAKLLGFEVRKIKTDDGIIDAEELREQAPKASAFLYSNPGGYFAEQPTRKIYNACKGKCLCIMDVSGCIGDKDLCNGDYADVMIGSFGRWKPVNMEYGGFVSAKDKLLYHGKSVFPMLKVNFDYDALLEKLKKAPERIHYFYGRCVKIKQDLKGFDIAHKDRKGINVVVKFSSETEKKKIVDYCDNHKLEYTICPRYIRLMDDAVSIEVKRLEA